MISLDSPYLMLTALAFSTLALVVRRRLAIGPPALRFSAMGDLIAVRGRGRHISRAVLAVLEVLILIAICVALGRPRVGHQIHEVLTPGVDIVVALDLSGSMRAEDMGEGISRIHAAKKVVSEFIAGRTQDRIGLVLFAAQAFTQCPLTLDYPLLQSLVTGLDLGTINEDATAIGMGIVTALARLKDSPAKSRVIIVVTDGQNNAGSIDPLTAADLAKGLGVKIYTIGIGGHGPAPYPVNDPVFGKHYVTIPEDLNEDVLQKVAAATGGIYQRAASAQALESIFKSISSLEKTEIKAKTYTLYDELFGWLLWPAFGAMLAQILLSTTLWRRIP